jgi:hypothetical protein
LLIGALAVLLASPCAARAVTLLGPARPSDLFDLGTTFDPCPSSGGRVFGSISRAGQDAVAFAVPAGQVAVVTAIDVSAVWIGGAPSAAGRYVQLVITARSRSPRKGRSSRFHSTTSCARR